MGFSAHSYTGTHARQAVSIIAATEKERSGGPLYESV